MSQMNVQSRKSGIQGFKLFSELEEYALLDLLGRGTFLRAIDGESLLREGQNRAQGIYIILEGTIQIQKSGKVLGSMGRGDFFGEISALGASPLATATVVAQTSCRLILIPTDEIARWGKRFPAEESRFFRGLAKELSQRLSSTSARLGEQAAA